MRKLSVFFAVLAVLLSDVMCFTVGYSYCNMLWGIQYACFSAPASVAFLLAIPYGIGIAVCAAVSAVLWRRSKRV